MWELNNLFRLFAVALLVAPVVVFLRSKSRGRVAAFAALYLAAGSVTVLGVQIARGEFFWTAVYLAGDWHFADPMWLNVVEAFALSHVSVAIAVALVATGHWRILNRAANALVVVGAAPVLTLVAYAPLWWRALRYIPSAVFEPPGLPWVIAADFTPGIVAGAALLMWTKWRTTRADRPAV